MKGIVLEKRNGYAAVLRDDGLVVKARITAEVGDQVELNDGSAAAPKHGRPVMRIVRTAVAAVLALAITGGAYGYTNVAAASYVTLDTEESSVELSVNRMGRVVGVRALDEDSEELARALYADIRRKPVEDAVDAAMERMDGAGTVVAGILGENERRAASLQQAVERGACRGEHGDLEFIALEVSREDRREAGEHDMSAGRFAFERDGGRWPGDAHGPMGEPQRPDLPPPPEGVPPADLGAVSGN